MEAELADTANLDYLGLKNMPRTVIAIAEGLEKPVIRAALRCGLADSFFLQILGNGRSAAERLKRAENRIVN